MLIGIDASRSTAGQRTGTENYSLFLIRELLAMGLEHRFRLYFNQAPPPALFPDNADVRTMPFPRLWTHLRLSWEMLASTPDLLFVPAHVLPLIHPRRTIVTVHDLGYLYFPEAHTLTQNAYLRWSTRHNARSASRVLADSEATRQDLVGRLQIPADKIRVIYPGRDESLSPVQDPNLLASVRDRYGIPETYLLYVGTLHPRKNLVRLVQAFALLFQSPISSSQSSMPNLHLVLAGQKGWLYEDLFAEIRRLGLEERVRLTGYVPDADLPPLLSGAVAFVYPSLHEGFGLPVLEAMSCGTPVVCSSTSSLPEVAGDAALLVDPLDVEAWAQSLHQVAADQELRRSLVERGHLQIQRFSWQRCASETLQVFEELAGPHGGRR
jgi:glycosyltransferase involved in cell wall biosynthesis